SGWQGMIGHNWGAQHAERWIWIHGLVDDGWLDVILARIPVAGRLTPWMAMGGLSVDGAITRIGRGIPGRGVILRERPDGCEFGLPGGIRGKVSAASADFVGWTYADPDGSTHDVIHSSIA